MRVNTVLSIVALFSLPGQQACAFVTPQSIAVPGTARQPSTLAVVAGAESVVTDLLVATSNTAAAASSNWLSAAQYPVSPEPIHSAFKVGTFFSQPFFLLMILFPKSSITKKIMGGLGKQWQGNDLSLIVFACHTLALMLHIRFFSLSLSLPLCPPEIPLAYALIHFFIVAASIATEGSGVTAPLSEFNNVFDPAGDSQQAFMGMVSNYPNFTAEEVGHPTFCDYTHILEINIGDPFLILVTCDMQELIICCSC